MIKEDLHILVIDDETGVRATLKKLLASLGFPDTNVVENGKTGLEALEKEAFDLVFLDYKMPGLDGLQTLAKIKKKFSSLPVVLMTAYGTVKTAVQAIKDGAYDYITKPFELPELTKILSNLSRNKRLESENRELKAELHSRYELKNMIIGVTPEMQHVAELVLKAARTDSTVLIRGESGTGKELIAKAIHHAGTRKDNRFVIADCSAINPNIIESELFGHERGAFTGAVEHKKGLIQSAYSGTLFLDEIGELPPDIQVKLLRVIQEKTVKPVGSEETIKVDVRIIAATNRNLEEMLAEGTFREDVYYRINVVPIHIPPLRERFEDIGLLADHFIENLQNTGMQLRGITDESLELLKRYSWPGNVRELENVIERAATLGSHEIIESHDLPPHLQDGEDPKMIQPKSLKSLELEAIRKALKKTNGDIPKTAKLLNIHRSTLYRKLKRHGITHNG
ncbi:MAG: sigma-54-dependent Fis family transcriptional regulator [Planctomycetota bacterium]|nr:MAG: sigma-54-dependent Fis family transcriptional regulator [Planctomycetota bacterium]